jgi:hypothetical protein
MTNQENTKPKKIPVTTYFLNEKKYFMIYPTNNGYHCFARVPGKDLSIDQENLNGLYEELAKQLDKLTINLLNEAGENEEISLRIKENIKSNENPLEKLIKDLGGEIRERKIK